MLSSCISFASSPAQKPSNDSVQMFSFLCFFGTATHILVSKAVPKARSCLSAHSSLVLPIHFQHNELRGVCVCSFLYTSGLQLVCSEGSCWHTLHLLRPEGAGVGAALQPRSDSVRLNHCWRQMSLTWL